MNERLKKSDNLNKSKSQNFIAKQEKELFWAKIFIHHINRSRGFDYKVEPHQNIHSLIDTKAVSRSGKYPELNMQLTWVEEIEFNPSKEPTKYLFFNKNKIEEAISRKTPAENTKNVSNIILLLQGYMAEPWADDILTDQFCDQYKVSPFKGIYYIVRPFTNSSGEEDPKNGSVLPIKSFL